ncbi:MAG TPA: ABATE domain-containing protein [Candidatus Acidoferrum sp.]|jgi:predicted RNA-binding Zn ribbon-like protein|nr:ABATE domain-containing protein [Candidatus Acidoferrum sp.]
MPETKTGRRRPPKFELIGGNICLDFINTLDDRPSDKPKELLTNYYELARFGEDTGILTPEQLDSFYERVHLAPDGAEDAVRRARNLREALHDILSAVMNKQNAPQMALDRLNANLHDAALHSRLVQREGRLEWRFDEMTSSFNAMLWPIARAGADLLTSPDVARVRACSSPTCQWLFIDTSKNHHRRWCSMKQCGNRAKVRRFYARRKTVG